MESRIVFTDFDGTFIKGDSYIRSLLFFSGYLNFFKTSPELIFIVIEYFLKFITRDEAKRRSFEAVFRGMNTDHIEKKLEDFYFQMHVFPKVKKKIGELRDAGCKIIIVTASPDIYMNYMAKKFSFDGCICTESEKEGNILTGKLKGKNCNYAEKVSRIKNSEYFNPDAQIIVFGNSRGDEEMFKISTEFYFVDKIGNIKKGKTPW
ncbi:MAG TPA: HAD family hydrolase [Clostridiales bacterium]|nr:HAD family hydrolase [Clostridiales bacterium]HQP69688.1 HAD family hydrolase [Clostridiales bacterium]